MTSATFFVQECPTCGRQLQVRVEYLGKIVACRHCKASFDACDPSSQPEPPAESGLALLRRADEILSTIEQSRVRPV